jgi:hypothetical protein
MRENECDKLFTASWNSIIRNRPNMLGRKPYPSADFSNADSNMRENKSEQLFVLRGKLGYTLSVKHTIVVHKVLWCLRLLEYFKWTL